MQLANFYGRPTDAVLDDPRLPNMHQVLLDELEAGRIRSAERDGDNWRAVPWVKEAILVGFRHTGVEDMSGFGSPAVDKSAFPPRRFRVGDGVRLVPGGSAARRGAHIAPSVVIMPPAYINVGAFVDAGTMIDSHALVGSCAQLGQRVHLSAGAQIGGVLEPAGAVPVVIEDDVFVGGLVGLFEGIHVRSGAVLASGVVLTGSTVIYDLVRERTWRRQVPEGAVVVPGSRPAKGGFAARHGLSVAAPMIVKYRDERTDAATALEGALRHGG